VLRALFAFVLVGCAAPQAGEEPLVRDGVYDLAVEQATCEVSAVYRSGSPVVLARAPAGLVVPTPWPRMRAPPFPESEGPLVFVAEDDALCPGGLVRYTMETSALAEGALTLSFARIAEKCATTVPACSVRATFTRSR